MAVSHTERQLKHQTKLQTTRQKFEHLVRYVVLVSFFRRQSEVSKAVRWLEREPLPMRLQRLAKKRGPGLKLMEEYWADAVSSAPLGIKRSDLKHVRRLVEAEYQLAALGDEIPPANGDPSPSAWQRSRDEWMKREIAADRAIALIDEIVPIEQLLPTGTKTAEPTGAMSGRDISDLVG